MRINTISQIIIIMSLLASLPSSSFFLSGYLTRQINNNNYNDGQLAHALKKNNVAALIVQEAQAKPGSDDWLDLNRKLAKTQSGAALKLANWYLSSPKWKQQGVGDKVQAIMWFKQAIRLDSQKAIVQLAQLHFERGDAVEAKNTLALLKKELANVDLIETRSILTAKIAIHLGNIRLVEQVVNSEPFELHLSNKSESLLADIVNFSIIANSKTGQSTVANKNVKRLETTADCISSLQLFATNLAHLKHLERLIKSFKVQQPLAQYICLPTPRYINPGLLDCTAGSQRAISCNEARFANVAKQVNTRHIGLMLAKGGANVHLGMLYFDADDDVDVFSHEVSHLLGFVDEYPIAKNHNKCQRAQQRAFSHNIVVLNDYYHGEQQVIREKILADVPWASLIKGSTPILQAVDNISSSPSLSKARPSKKIEGKDNWRLGTPIEYKEQVGLHISESCDNTIFTSDITSRYSAYKPLHRHTQLRYYASDFPKEYLSVLAERPLEFIMPSFHYNIALALFQQDNIEDGKRLLHQALLWEDNPRRKALVLKGQF